MNTNTPVTDALHRALAERDSLRKQNTQLLSELSRILKECGRQDFSIQPTGTIETVAHIAHRALNA